MAYDIGPRIGIEGEKEYRDALNKINTNLKTLGTEMSTVTSQFAKGDKSMDAVTAQNKVLNKQITEQKQKLSELQKGLAAASEKYGDSDKVTQRWQQSVNKATTDLNKMERSLKENGAAMDDYAKNTIQAANNGEQFQKAQEKMHNVLGVVKKAALAAGTAIAATFTASAKSAVDYESAFAGVEKTVEATQEQLTELSDGIRQMAKEIPVPVKEIAAIAESAGQLGIETDSILSFTQTIADLGMATNLTGDEAASALAKFANITQMPQEQFDRLGSTVVALGNNLATTEADVVSMAMRLAGAGSQVGMSQAQILSFSGALSSVGIEAEAGGSAFSKVMVAMQLAAETGSAQLGDFAQVAGMSAQDFATAFEDDAASAMISFIQGLGDAQEHGQSAIKILDDMEIKEVRLRDALLRAAGASDLFSDAIELGSEAWAENTALSDEAAQRYETTASQFQTLKNNLNDVFITIGEQLIPIMKDWTDKLKEIDTQPIVDGFQWLVDNAGNIAGAAVGIGVAMAGWNIMTTVGAVVRGIKEWKLATETLTIAQKALNLAQGASPVGIIITLVAALAAALITLWHTNDDFREAVTNAWNGIKETAVDVWSAVTHFFTVKIPDAFRATLDFIKTNWPSLLLLLVNPFAGAIKLLYDLNPQFKAWVDELLSKFKNWIGGFVDIGKNIVRGIWDGIKSMASWLWNKVSDFMGGIVDGVKDALGIHSPSRVFAGIGQYMAEGLGQGFSGAMREISRQVNGSMAFTAPAVPNQQTSLQNAPAPMAKLTVILDGKVIGEAVTPIVSQNLHTAVTKSSRGRGVTLAPQF